MDNRPAVIVKVGKTSNIRFRGVKALRAITFDEVQRLAESYPGVAALIIESILPYETQLASNTVEFIRNKGKEVFIHNINGANSQELSLSEEKGVPISTNLDELQHSISAKLAIRTYTAWGRQIDSDNTEDAVIEEQNKQSVGTSDTESHDLKEAISALDNSETEEIKYETIGTKEDLIETLGLEDLDLEWSFSDEESDREDNDKLKEEKDRNYIELNKLLEEVTKERQDLSDQLGKAFDRISTLLDIKEAVEDERDMYKTMLEGIDNNSNIIEDPIPGAKLDEAKIQISNLQQANINLEQQIIEYKAEKSALDTKISNLLDEIEATKKDIEQLKLEIDERDDKIARLNEGLSANESVKLELANVKADKTALEKSVQSLKGKIKELTSEIDTAMSRSSADDLEKIQSLRLEIDNLNEEINKANSRTAIESRGRLVINLMLAEAVSQKSNASKALIEKNSEVAELKALAQKLKNSIKSSEEEFRLLRQKYDELDKSQETKDERFNSKIEVLQENYTNSLNELKVELDTRTQETKRLRAELNETKKTLNTKETELANLMLTSGASKNDIKKAMDAKRTMEETNKKLSDTVEMLKKEVRSLTSKVSMTEDANERLEETNKNLRASIATFKATSNIPQSPTASSKQTSAVNMGRIRLDCDYSGRGFIIPVFGSGSYGVTTMAISIARKLPKASVLYMDFDIVSPKADAWFGKMPIIKELKDIVDPLKRSALGALIEKGSNYVFDNKKFIFQRATETKQGSTIDYFSGAYSKVDPRKLMAVNFSEFMTHVGNMYNYIVVDLGRLGSSDTSDELIKMFNKIAYKSVIVTLNDKFDTRNMSVRIASDKIILDNTIWVLNMSDSSKVDNIVQKSMGKAKPVIFQKEMSLYGSGLSFDRVPILKDKLSQVMDILKE